MREGSKIALLSLGTRLGECLKAADQLAAWACRRRSRTRASPSRSTRSCSSPGHANHELLITVEEGSIGGFGTQVLHWLAQSGLLDRRMRVRSLVLPDSFIDHDSPEAMYGAAGLDAAGIVGTACKALGLGDAPADLKSPARA